MGEDIRYGAELQLYHVFSAGKIRRSEFKQMSGLGARTANSLLTALLDTALVESGASRTPLRFGLPLERLVYYFPRLYTEAAA